MAIQNLFQTVVLGVPRAVIFATYTRIFEALVFVSVRCLPSRWSVVAPMNSLQTVVSAIPSLSSPLSFVRLCLPSVVSPSQKALLILSA